MLSGRWRGALLTVTAAFLIIVPAHAAAAVEATPTYAYGAFGAPGTAPGTFDLPTDIAVEPGTGNVLVADSGNGRVQVFAPGSGVSPTFLTSFGPAASPPLLTKPVGLAIDQSSGAIYVSDSGAKEIFRFTSDGAPVPTYTRDLSFESPELGSGAGQVGSFASAIAIDPTNHDLVVADSGNNRVERFTAGGAPVPSFNGTASVNGAFTLPLDIAVGITGSIYVLDVEGTQRDELFYPGVPAHVRRFTATGASAGELEGTETPSAVAVDPTTGNVLVSGDSIYLANPRRIHIYSDAGLALKILDLASGPDISGQGYASAIHGLAVEDSASGGRIYALGDEERIFSPNGYVETQVLRPTAIPGVEVGEPTEIGQTSAHLSGTVAPGGEKTSVRFEYQFEGGASWQSSPDQILVGSGEQAVTADLTGIRPNTKYSVRLHASNAFFENVSGLKVFTTPVRPPDVSAVGVSDITQTSAALHGKILPNGLQTTYYFEYGPTTEYGARVPLDHDDVVGRGHQIVPVSSQITGLQPGTEYHFRLIAISSAGTTEGEDAVLTTEDAGVPPRGYEMVSPVEKNGVPADSNRTGARASEDGNAIVFGTEKSSYPGAQANPYIPRAFGLRSSTDWASGPLTLPFDQHIPGYKYFYSIVAVSKDLSHALMVSTAKLTPDAVEGEFNLYLTDFTGKNPILVATDPAIGQLASSNGNYVQVGTSDDLHTIAFIAGISGGPMMEATLGVGLRVASVMPNGEAESGAVQNDRHMPNQVSADGSRIFFSAFEGVFVRENGAVTKRISPGVGGFVAASPDGRYVVFEEGGGVYRYDLETETLKQLVAGGVSGTLATLPETGDAYYITGDQLHSHLYFEHEGTSTHIGDPLDSIAFGGPFGSINEFAMSPNGRYLAFQSVSNLTSFDAEDNEEVFLYDSQTDTLSCPSCRQDGGKATGNASLGTAENGGSPFNRLAARSVLDDGTVFFDTPEPLLVADANGTRDVYSYREGRTRLISRGKLPTESTFLEATPDGSSVFFVTDDRLVGQDRDDVPDVYVSRLGGGLASQNPPPPIECLRDDCKATPNDGPELPFGGSEGLSGPGNVTPVPRKHCGKGRHPQKSKGKVRCVKSHREQAKNNRRQAR